MKRDTNRLRPTVFIDTVPELATKRRPEGDQQWRDSERHRREDDERRSEGEESEWSPESDDSGSSSSCCWSRFAERVQRLTTVR